MLLISLISRPSVSCHASGECSRQRPAAFRRKLCGLTRLPQIALLTSLLLALTSGLGKAAEVVLRSGDTAPAELTQIVTQLDQAASREDRRGVMRLYSRSFTHSDGLTYRTLNDALNNFWNRFSNLNYRTVITGWQQDANGLVAETTTTVRGTQMLEGRVMNLTATIRSRQRYENGKIAQQEILAEQVRLTSGQNPPTVQILLPEQVSLGREFNFDAIVQEPLGDRLLLGAAVDAPVDPSQYIMPAPADLELLPAGGLFKIGRAPATPGSRWLSAVIVREDGITIETRRLRVTPATAQP